ncbi:hypothetical protein NM688_g5662 [Phlebia brevispora]|uniref:Uncharacterized protein n=1 Tax=Phlebia brevispora TaxID=194682 RepID=A0ACC1SSA4_9APHY|nr:hypothetical protein NM688_g5662 [Phlebia brevispora]
MLQESNSAASVVVPWTVDCTVPQKRRLSHPEEGCLCKRRLICNSPPEMVTRSASAGDETDSCSEVSGAQQDDLDSDGYEMLEIDQTYCGIHGSVRIITFKSVASLELKFSSKQSPSLIAAGLEKCEVSSGKATSQLRELDILVADACPQTGVEEAPAVLTREEHVSHDLVSEDVLPFMRTEEPSEGAFDDSPNNGDDTKSSIDRVCNGIRRIHLNGEVCSSNMLPARPLGPRFTVKQREQAFLLDKALLSHATSSAPRESPTGHLMASDIPNNSPSTTWGGKHDYSRTIQLQSGTPAHSAPRPLNATIHYRDLPTYAPVRHPDVYGNTVLVSQGNITMDVIRNSSGDPPPIPFTTRPAPRSTVTTSNRSHTLSPPSISSSTWPPPGPSSVELGSLSGPLSPSIVPQAATCTLTRSSECSTSNFNGAGLPCVSDHPPRNGHDQGEGYLADDETEDNRVIQLEQHSTSTQLKNAINKQVRNSLLHLLGLHAGGTPVPPPSEGEIREFMEGRGAGPSISCFRLDYNSPKSRYNEEAFYQFGEFFSALVATHTFPDIQLQYYMTPSYFANIASSKLRLLKDRYRAISPPGTNSPETAEAKVARVSMRYLEERQVQRRAGRRIGLLKHRRKIVREFPEESPWLALIDRLLDLLGPAGMSSDETDDTSTPRQKRLRRVRRPWVNPVITKAFKQLDACYSRIKCTGQPIPGNTFRERLYDHHNISAGKPKPGLPRNVYDPEYLNALPLYRLQSLDPAAEIDLSLLGNEFRITRDCDRNSPLLTGLRRLLTVSCTFSGATKVK